MEEQDSIDQMAQDAAAPARASGDSGSMEQHPLKDRIAFDQYRAAAANKRGLPFRRVQLRPGGNADIDVGRV